MDQRELIDILRSDVVEGARALLGATLVKGTMRARIVETEAYRGQDDPASHSFGRSQMKNMALFGEPGSAYIYLSYGSHWMLNVVALPAGESAAVLVRAAEPLAGFEQFRRHRNVSKDHDLLSGPGKLAQAFGIGPDVNGLPLLLQGELRIEPRLEPEPEVLAGARVGIAVGKWHDVPWRFVDADRLRWVSPPKPRPTAYTEQVA